jgi:hypothetical protein
MKISGYWVGMGYVDFYLVVGQHQQLLWSYGDRGSAAFGVIPS